MYEGDLEPCDLWHEAVVKKSRKDHCCDGCRTVIPKGSSYWKHASSLDGGMTSEKMCLECYDVRASLAAVEMGGMLCTPSALVFFLQEAVQGNPNLAITLVALIARGTP